MSRLAECAEAEPKLLDIAEQIKARAVDAPSAASALLLLASGQRFEADWKVMVGGLKVPQGRDEGLYRLAEWEKRVPQDSLLRRVHGRSVFDNLCAELGLHEKRNVYSYGEPYAWPVVKEKSATCLCGSAAC